MSGLDFLLILAMLATVAALAMGLVSMYRGGDFNARYGNLFMRARVGFQFVALLVIGLIFLSR